jgi:hypothetical protein
MKERNEKKIALTVGLFAGVVHLIWTLFIIIGFAQPLLNFIFWVHMVDNPYIVTGFTFSQSIMLIIATFAVGYIAGLIFAKVWNAIHK